MFIDFKSLIGRTIRHSLWKPKFQLIKKVPPIKRKWQIEAEKKFIQDRESYPDEYIHGLRPLHLMSLHPHIRRLIHLRCASMKTLRAYRIHSLRQKIGLNIFDRNSLGVKSM